MGRIFMGAVVCCFGRERQGQREVASEDKGALVIAATASPFPGH